MQKSKTAKKTGKKVASKKVAKKSNSLKANKKVNESKVTTKSTKNIQSTPNVVNVVDKKDKAPKKSHELTIWLLIVSFLLIITGALGVGIYFAGKPKAAKVKIETPTIEGLTFKNLKAYIGQDYSTEISIDIAKTGEYRLPAKLKSVKSGNRTIANTEYTYDLADNKETADFYIPGKYIEGDINIDLELEIPVPPVTEYKVSLVGEDKENLTLTGSAAYTDKEFSETISIDLKKAPYKIMPNELKADDVKCLDEPIKFKYTPSEDKHSANIKIQPSEIKGDITIDVALEDCEHEYSSYTVIDNKLYGICEKCGARKLIPDSDLSEFTGKFLMIENSEGSSEDKYVLHEIKEMADIVNGAKSESNLDIYFINGEYELGGNRAEGQGVVTVNAHGLLNSNSEPNASIDCTRLSEYPFPRFHLSINFNFENLKMSGERRYDAGFYFGLFASEITYNNCYFEGKQSLYSQKVVFTDCNFDSTEMEDDTPVKRRADYAIYCYSSPVVEFNFCNFMSDGKAVKIYSEGPIADSLYTFNDCNFKIRELISDDHPAIQVDGTYQTENDPYEVYINRCEADKRYNEKGEEAKHKELCGDSAGRTNFHVDGEN